MGSPLITSSFVSVVAFMAIPFPARLKMTKATVGKWRTRFIERRIAGPFNRVEGDLEVVLDIEGGRVAAATGREVVLHRPGVQAVTTVVRKPG